MSKKQSKESNKAPKTKSKTENPLDRLKVEIAKELGLWEKVQQEGWGGLTAAESGRIGGIMTRHLRHGQK